MAIIYCYLPLLISILIRSANALTFRSVEIPRLSVEEFQAQQQQDDHNHHEDITRPSSPFRSSLSSSSSSCSPPRPLQAPILIEGLVSSTTKLEDICEDLLTPAASFETAASSRSSLAPVEVTLQRRRRRRKLDEGEGDEENDETTIYPSVPIEKALRAVQFNSHHDDALLVFEEGYLQEHCDVRLTKELRDLRESAFVIQKEIKRQEDDEDDDDDDGSQKKSTQHDWFQFFPASSRPSDCLVIAGEGATSTLHRDPFMWTGTSLCLEGSKIWRFLEPITPSQECDSLQWIDHYLRAYQLQSNAWDANTLADHGNDDHHHHHVNMLSLSSGWQSDYSLFRYRADGIPSAREWNDLYCFDDHDSSSAVADDTAEGHSLHDRMHREGKYRAMLEIALSEAHLGPDLPPLADHHPQPRQEKTHPRNRNSWKIWTTVQQPGDLLLIPGHWWHQTYGLEPSVAIASQRCSDGDATRVFRHILQAHSSSGGLATGGTTTTTRRHHRSPRRQREGTNHDALLQELVKNLDYSHPKETTRRFFRLLKRAEGRSR